MSRTRRRQQGQAVVEYTVGLLVIYWILFDAAFWDGKTAIEVLVNAFQSNYHGYEYAQSQPVLD